MSLHLRSYRRCPHSIPPTCRPCSSSWAPGMFLHNKPGFQSHSLDPPSQLHTHSEGQFVSFSKQNWISGNTTCFEDVICGLASPASPGSLVSGWDRWDMTTGGSRGRPGTGGRCSGHTGGRCYMSAHKSRVHIGLKFHFNMQQIWFWANVQNKLCANEYVIWHCDFSLMGRNSFFEI